MPAIQFIKVNGAASPQAAQLLRYIQAMQNAFMQSGLALDTAQNLTDGANFATLETQFGLVTGNGGAVYNALVSSNAILYGTAQGIACQTIASGMG